jgi:acyl-CoA reductase-like NAD-dependent aldehyde dehydrogenase
MVDYPFAQVEGDTTHSGTAIRLWAGASIPLLTAQGSVQRINKLLEDALTNEAEIGSGGLAKNALMSPTLVDRVTTEMDIYDEETFRPVIAIIRVEGAEQALDVANDTA